MNCVENMHALKILEVSNNRLAEIPKLPENLEELIFDRNRITKMKNFENASRLRVLNIAANKVKLIENI